MQYYPALEKNKTTHTIFITVYIEGVMTYLPLHNQAAGCDI